MQKLKENLRQFLGVRQEPEFANFPQALSLDDCRQKVELMNWQEALRNYRHFLIENFGTKNVRNETILQIFWERLFRFERPVLNIDALKYYYMLFRVDNGISDAELKEEVAFHTVSGPRIIIEDNGRLRGFILHPHLIIAGVTAAGALPDRIKSKISHLGVSLLTSDEAKFVDNNWNGLNALMHFAGVPDLDKIDIFMLKLPENDSSVYSAWSHQQGQTVNLSPTSGSQLLARL